MYESGEDYIETIYLLKKKNGLVRSVDVARELGYSRPSVSRAVGLLKKGGYITVDDSGEIELTDEGKKKATFVYDRHKTLTKFFVAIAGVSEKTAENDACKVEHILSPSTFKGIKKYMHDHAEELDLK
ncbi:MAG: metal-dependent transcriptional regulator [Lachnospiraceae bacterium]|nr:metal-dependent transcriptional regulator [Lachnospiraceae bacterium]